MEKLDELFVEDVEGFSFMSRFGATLCYPSLEKIRQGVPIFHIIKDIFFPKDNAVHF